MITIESGKLSIPDDERFVGFSGDNLREEKRFALLHHTDRDCTFTLCLRFDDGTVREVVLAQFLYSSDVLLVWEIRREHLYSSGIVTAQIRIEYSGGEVLHTTKDYFFVSPSLDQSEDTGELVTRAELTEGLANAEGRARVYTDSAVGELSDNVYTKAEIDSMIGDAEALLAQV